MYRPTTNLNNKHIVEYHLRRFEQKLVILSFVKEEYVAELLYRVALNCIGVPIKVARECMFLYV